MSVVELSLNGQLVVPTDSSYDPTVSRVLAVESDQQVIADGDEWHHSQHLHRGTKDTIRELEGRGVHLLPTTLCEANAGASTTTVTKHPTYIAPATLTTYDGVVKGAVDIVPSRYLRMLRHRWDGRLEKRDLLLAFREAITCVNTQATRYHHFWEERLARMLAITGSTRLGRMRQRLVDAQGDLGDVEKAVKLFAAARKRCAALFEELVSHIGEFTDDFSLMMRAIVEEVTSVDWSSMEPPGREHAALSYQLADAFSDIHKEEEVELLLKGSAIEGQSVWQKLHHQHDGGSDDDAAYDPHERLLAGGRVAPKTQKLKKSSSAAASDVTGASVLPREAFSAVVIFTHNLPTFFHEQLLDLGMEVRPAVVDQHKFAMTEMDVWSCEPLSGRRLLLHQQKHVDAAALLLPPAESRVQIAPLEKEMVAAAIAAASPSNSSPKKSTLQPSALQKRGSGRPIDSAGSSRKGASVRGVDARSATTTDLPTADEISAGGIPAAVAAERSPPIQLGTGEPVVVTCCCYDTSTINLSTLFIGTESGAVMAIPVRATTVAEETISSGDVTTNTPTEAAQHLLFQEQVRSSISTLLRDWRWALEGKIAAKRQRRKEAAEARLNPPPPVTRAESMERSTNSAPLKSGSASSLKSISAKLKPISREASRGGRKGSSKPPTPAPTEEAPAPPPPNPDAAFDAKLPPRTLGGVTLFDGHLFPVTHLEYIPATQVLVSCSIHDKSVRFHSVKNGGRLINIESSSFGGAPSCSAHYGPLEAVVVGTYSGHLRMVDPRAGGPPVGVMRLPNHPIHSIAVDLYSSELFVGTRKGHIYGFRLNIDAHHYRPRLEPLNDEGVFSQECMHCFVPDVKDALGYKLNEPLVVPGMRSIFTNNFNKGASADNSKDTATSYSNVFTEDEEGSEIEDESCDDSPLVSGLQPIGEVDGASGRFVEPPTVYDDNEALLKGKKGIVERKHAGFHSDLRNRKIIDSRKKRRPPQSTSSRAIREAVTSGRHLVVTGGHTVAVTCMTPVSGFLFSGDALGKILQWDLITHELVRKFHGHSDDITSITITADGFLFATSKDALITVWNAVDGNILSTINRHYGSVATIALGYLGGGHVPNPFSTNNQPQPQKTNDKDQAPSVSAVGSSAAEASSVGGPTGTLRQKLDGGRQRGAGAISSFSSGGIGGTNRGGGAPSPVRFADLDHFVPLERPLNAVESLAAAEREAAAKKEATTKDSVSSPSLPVSHSLPAGKSWPVCSRENIRVGSPTPPLLLSLSSDQTVVSWHLKYRD